MKEPQQPTMGSPAGAGGEVTRRTFLKKGATATVALTALGGGSGAHAATNQAAPPHGLSTFLDVLRVPDFMAVYSRFEKTVPADRSVLQRSSSQWSGGSAGQRIVVESLTEPQALRFTLSAPSTSISVVHAHWQMPVAPGLLILGDAWERSYGELGWRNLVPERVMPWYFATHDGAACHGYGVKTDAGALCFWQVSQQGVSLWMNVTNGGSGVELGSRRLTMATVVSRQDGRGGGNPGTDEGTAVDAVTLLCKKMCARPSRTTQPIYGSNDWNYSYGHSTAETILRDTDFIVSVSPSGGARPFVVIDDGYKDGTASWPDMGHLADQIRQRQARPGIWIRPLLAPKDAAPAGLLPAARFGEKTNRAREFAYDPTHPEAQQRIVAKIKEVRGWGYEMVKHDFSTYDLLGQWGFEMGPQPTLPGWSLHDRTRTNAEVMFSLYAMLRETAGEGALIDGCNTVGHLGQGIFDLQRTGDDTSGRQWERTRRMGVNTLAFRLPQQGTFFTVDADLVGITDAVPWSCNRQWLDVLAKSGAATMVSPGPPAYGAEQREALRAAFKIAAAGGASARPVDWLASSTPERWQSRNGSSPEQHYDWNGSEGASPFLGP